MYPRKYKVMATLGLKHSVTSARCNTFCNQSFLLNWITAILCFTEYKEQQLQNIQNAAVGIALN